MRAQYRSVEDDVEQRSVSTLGENDDDERDDDAAGKGFGSSPFSRVAFALGAVALLGFGTIASRSSSSSYNSARGGNQTFRLGSRHHSSSSSSSANSRLGDGPDGAPICSQDLRMIEDKMSDGANANDPIKLAIQNDIPNLSVFPSIDPNWAHHKSSWYHTPAFSGSGGDDGFVMCLPGEWDDSYTYNFDSMFQEGMCIKEVRTDVQNGDFTGCDVRVFSQFAYIFKNDFKQGNITARAEDNVFHPPPKLSSDVVDFYYAHESPDHYGYELRGESEYSQKSLANMQYLAWFNGDPDSNLRSSVWYPFGPSVGSLMRDFKYFTKAKEERIPVVAWMSKDCVQRDRINLLVALSKHFPVFSMGRCEQISHHRRTMWDV
ncbi:unnamed protein product [Bathycoccus prasinos]